jgi:hypothetical protein
MKILFIPVSMLGGLISGFIAKNLFEKAWGVIDQRDPPRAAHRRPSTTQVVVAAALEGAIFKGTRAAIDHKSRAAFAHATGVWPGKEAPESD